MKGYDAQALIDAVTIWPELTAGAHAFAAIGFNFRGAEIGHVHANGLVDVPRIISDGSLETMVFVCLSQSTGTVTRPVKSVDAVWLDARRSSLGRASANGRRTA